MSNKKDYIKPEITSCVDSTATVDNYHRLESVVSAHIQEKMLNSCKNWCKNCGICCKAIVLPISLASACSKINPDIAFLRQHWHQLSAEEAFKINPYLKTWLSQHYYYYACDLLTEDNKCSVHYHKPIICSMFPWYGNGINPNLPLYCADCGFKQQAEEFLHEKEKLITEILTHTPVNKTANYILNLQHKQEQELKYAFKQMSLFDNHPLSFSITDLAQTQVQEEEDNNEQK